MTEILRERIRGLLGDFQKSSLDAEHLENELTALIGSEFETSDALVDVGREARLGFGEAIYAAGKTSAQVVGIFRALIESCGRALATRCSQETLTSLREAFPESGIDERARLAWFPAIHTSNALGTVAVLAAGTSDLPVAEEAAGTLAFAGIGVERFFDVGVAGIHRLLGRIAKVREADVIIVVAGMEGALPSVVGGLVAAPLIAVPTSVGYGASFQGLAALLAMLNGCSAGITVVNIDNGFGAAVAAARILKTLSRRKS
ncbi:MAG: nickel pincer cofactor biosynthesis protein LarB [Candidatus Ozemobacteraceae bacterium]